MRSRRLRSRHAPPPSSTSILHVHSPWRSASPRPSQTSQTSDPGAERAPRFVRSDRNGAPKHDECVCVGVQAPPPDPRGPDRWGRNAPCGEGKRAGKGSIGAEEEVGEREPGIEGGSVGLNPRRVQWSDGLKGVERTSSFLGWTGPSVGIPTRNHQVHEPIRPPSPRDGMERWTSQSSIERHPRTVV